MKEKIIQGGIVNGEKMLVCPTWEDEFQKAIHKTGGCFRISMDYSAVDVSWWKELEKIAGKYGYTLDSESLEIIQEYVQKYKKYENHFWEYGKKIITFEQFSRMLSKKAGIQPKEAKEYVVANLQNLEHKEILEAMLYSQQLIKSQKGLEGTQSTKPTCEFIKKEFEKIIDRLEKQIYKVDHIILLHTRDGQSLENLKQKYNNIVIVEIEPEEFDHAATRDKGIRISGADIVICMTQDACPDNDRLTEELVHALDNDRLAVAYARQLPRKESTILERYTRQFNYPAESREKTKRQVFGMGDHFEHLP